MSGNQHSWAAADYAHIMDPVLLQGERARQRTQANNIAVRRLKEAHPEEWAGLLAEEREAAEARWWRWLALKERHQAEEMAEREGESA